MAAGGRPSASHARIGCPREGPFPRVYVYGTFSVDRDGERGTSDGTVAPGPAVGSMRATLLAIVLLTACSTSTDIDYSCPSEPARTTVSCADAVDLAANFADAEGLAPEMLRCCHTTRSPSGTETQACKPRPVVRKEYDGVREEA